MAKFQTREVRTTEDRLIDRFTERSARRAARIRRKKVDPATAAAIRRLTRRFNDEDMDVSPDLIAEMVRDQMSRWASMGGRARARVLTPKRRREIARKAAAAKHARTGGK